MIAEKIGRQIGEREANHMLTYRLSKSLDYSHGDYTKADQKALKECESFKLSCNTEEHVSQKSAFQVCQWMPSVMTGLPELTNVITKESKSC